MNRLLASGFSRLKKNKLFWAGILFMAAYGFYKPVSAYRMSIKFHSTMHFQDLFFSYIFIMGILTAIFISFFLGTEYGDGTIRNKVIAGHSRLNIYLSNLIVSVCAMFLMCISYILAVSVVGIPLAGFFQLDTQDVLLLLLGTFLTVAAFCSVYTCLSMVLSSKSAAVAVAAAGSFIFLFGEAYLSSMLAVSGYVTGIKRTIYQVLLNILPSGQALQYAGLELSDLWQKMGCSLLVATAATLAGILIFKRKDIK